MNKLSRILGPSLLLVSLLIPALAQAETIVVLKPNQAILTTEKAIALGNQLSVELKPQVSRFEAMGVEVRTLQQRLQAEKDVMSVAEVQTLQAEIQVLVAEYQQLQSYLADAHLTIKQEFLTKMRPVLDKILRQLIEENNITLIINGESVIYNTAGIDITPKVVELLNLEP